jgi:hypothetical protein
MFMQPKTHSIYTNCDSQFKVTWTPQKQFFTPTNFEVIISKTNKIEQNNKAFPTLEFGSNVKVTRTLDYNKTWALKSWKKITLKLTHMVFNSNDFH